MTAGLFVRHGLWAGSDLMQPGRWNEKGTFENNSVKRVLVEEFGRLVNRGEESPGTTERFKERFLSVIQQGAEPGVRWLVKVSVMYWRAFEAFSPIYITVRRPVESIMESNRKSGMLHRHHLAKTVSRHMDLLDQREAEGALRIDSPRLIERDYGQISEVFAECGLSLDERIADEWVAPRLWHY